ncbi:hypothetical protein TWF191_004971 [Orbilia oligospora]|uniref:alpha-L-rhamnosidase n=1 Tax=Orbilia oligospora TaxID=2813651 RepID=A0A7C8UYQ7_ORBOL|nr:hypothetical protein TWF191_004971 [Orbilia oligospora]
MQRPQQVITPVAPVQFKRIRDGATVFADFGADAYGNLQINIPPPVAATTLAIRLGEKLDATGAIDRRPYGSVNYRWLTLVTQPNRTVYQIDIPPKPRHSNPQAVHMPPQIGEVTVFRYAEIDNAPANLNAEALHQLWVHTAFDDNNSFFRSSNDTLNAVWDLCKHTIKATTAFGVYVDGERERIPYEADSYINQLSHMAVDANPEVARYTFEHMLKNPTWPTEWSLHMPMIAAFDYMFTGDIKLTSDNYEALKKKLLMDKARGDGLIRAPGIVDWPAGERDGFNDGDQQNQSGPEINTVVNAFYYHALLEMATVAKAAGRIGDALLFKSRAKAVYNAFNAAFFDRTRGIYIDGEGSTHASLHANMFPLAFDLVPRGYQSQVADFVQSRGMGCSVYAAQYLLEALYKAGRDEYALELMTSHSDRSWWHMIELGSTMTLEAWDVKYKPNLTWNHAWGAAPANIISRYILGVRPLKPGFEKILIAPQPGSLEELHGKVPTMKGPVLVKFQPGVLEIDIPEGTTARVLIPYKLAKSQQYPPQLSINGIKESAKAESGCIVVDEAKEKIYTLAAYTMDHVDYLPILQPLSTGPELKG